MGHVVWDLRCWLCIFFSFCNLCCKMLLDHYFKIWLKFGVIRHTNCPKFKKFKHVCLGSGHFFGVDRVLLLKNVKKKKMQMPGFWVTSTLIRGITMLRSGNMSHLSSGRPRAVGTDKLHKFLQGILSRVVVVTDGRVGEVWARLLDDRRRREMQSRGRSAWTSCQHKRLC